MGAHKALHRARGWWEGWHVHTSISCSPPASDLTCSPAGPPSLKLNVKQCQMPGQWVKTPLSHPSRQCLLNAPPPSRRCSL